MIKYSIGLSLFLYLIGGFAYSQDAKYRYKRDIIASADSIAGWGKITLPDDLFGKVQQDLSDIRIIGISESRDSVEIPYLVHSNADEVVQREVPFRIVNSSRKNDSYFYTLEVSKEEAINTIRLSFEEENFDWSLTLEGSMDLEEWFTLLENYRIVSIHNEWTRYVFSRLTFPIAKFRYYRIAVPSTKKPRLAAAKLISREVKKGKYRTYSPETFRVREDKKRRETIVDIKLPSTLPVSSLQTEVAETMDYYRQMTIQYLIDSIKTAQGWQLNYRTIANEVLSSLEDQDFQFPQITTSALRLIIQNNDNIPLQFSGFGLKGKIIDLKAQFPTHDAYCLLYGSKAATAPVYDIYNFQNKIPTELPELELGKEQVVPYDEVNKATPLFQDQRWLWAIMGLIICVLAWFSVSMMRKA